MTKTSNPAQKKHVVTIIVKGNYTGGKASTMIITTNTAKHPSKPFSIAIGSQASTREDDSSNPLKVTMAAKHPTKK